MVRMGDLDERGGSLAEAPAEELGDVVLGNHRLDVDLLAGRDAGDGLGGRDDTHQSGGWTSAARGGRSSFDVHEPIRPVRHRRVHPLETESGNCRPGNEDPIAFDDLVDGPELERRLAFGRGAFEVFRGVPVVIALLDDDRTIVVDPHGGIVCWFGASGSLSWLGYVPCRPIRRRLAPTWGAI